MISDRYFNKIPEPIDFLFYLLYNIVTAVCDDFYSDGITGRNKKQGD